MLWVECVIQLGSEARVEGRGMAGSEGGSGNESQGGGVGASMLRQVMDSDAGGVLRVSDEGAGSERLIDDYDGLLGRLGYKGNSEGRGSPRAVGTY